jgi:tyrosine-protein phosphatase YwqE
MHLLRGMSALGYKKVITTPHIMIDAYKNTPEIIKSGLDDVRRQLVLEEIDIEIDAAAEYYLDDGFLSLLEKGDLMLVKGKYLLFETSYISKPLALEEMIFEIGRAGYTPLMAHPERYRYIKNPEKEYGRLKDLGVMFQVNLNSFGGHYGKSAKTLVSFLKDRGMISFLGSDVHRQKQVETLSDVFVSEAYHEIFRKNKILNNLL